MTQLTITWQEVQQVLMTLMKVNGLKQLTCSRMAITITFLSTGLDAVMELIPPMKFMLADLHLLLDLLKTKKVKS